MKSDFTLRGESHLSGVNLKEIQVVLATYFYRYPSPKNFKPHSAFRTSLSAFISYSWKMDNSLSQNFNLLIALKLLEQQSNFQAIQIIHYFQ